MKGETDLLRWLVATCFYLLLPQRPFHTSPLTLVLMLGKGYTLKWKQRTPLSWHPIGYHECTGRLPLAIKQGLLQTKRAWLWNIITHQIHLQFNIPLPFIASAECRKKKRSLFQIHSRASGGFLELGLILCMHQAMKNCNRFSIYIE